jgi:hypothetical protein
MDIIKSPKMNKTSLIVVTGFDGATDYAPEFQISVKSRPLLFTYGSVNQSATSTGVMAND